MNFDERQGAPFDEQAAVEELDGVSRELEASRQRRRNANDAFDRFLKSFGRSTPEPPAPSRAGRGGTARAPSIDLPPPAIPSPGLPARWAGPIGLQGQMAGGTRAHEETPRDAPSRPRTLPGRALLGVAAVTLGAFVVFVGGGAREGQEAPPPALPGEQTTASKPTTPSEPATGVPSEALPAAGPPLTELTTMRHVWVRVVVDGERVLERELPAGERVPLSPRRTIAVRAGDGGAVRLTVDGKDQGILGANGRAVTRTFDVTALR